MQFIYAMEYYSAMRQKEILPFATVWMDPEGIILSEISQTEKDKYFKHFLVSFMWNLRNKTKP